MYFHNGKRYFKPQTAVRIRNTQNFFALCRRKPRKTQRVQSYLAFGNAEFLVNRLGNRKRVQRTLHTERRFRIFFVDERTVRTAFASVQKQTAIFALEVKSIDLQTGRIYIANPEARSAPLIFRRRQHRPRWSRNPAPRSVYSREARRLEPSTSSPSRCRLFYGPRFSPSA